MNQIKFEDKSNGCTETPESNNVGTTSNASNKVLLWMVHVTIYGLKRSLYAIFDGGREENLMERLGITG